MNKLICLVLIMGGCGDDPALPSHDLDTQDAEVEPMLEERDTPTCDEVEEAYEAVAPSESCQAVVEDGCLQLDFATASGNICRLDACLAVLPPDAELDGADTCRMSPSFRSTRQDGTIACGCFREEVLHEGRIVLKRNVVRCAQLACPIF